MNNDYRNIPVQKVIDFAESANFSRLVRAKRNIEEYIYKCDYSAENLTTEILAPNTSLYAQRRLVNAKITILVERGAAYKFLAIIQKEMDARMQEYETRMRRVS